MRGVVGALNINRTSVILGTRALHTRGKSSTQFWNHESRWVAGAWLAARGPLYFGMVLSTMVTAMGFGFLAAELMNEGPFRDWAVGWLTLFPLCAGACGLLEIEFRVDNASRGPMDRPQSTPRWEVDLVRNPAVLLPSSVAGYLLAALAAQVLVVLLP